MNTQNKKEPNAEAIAKALEQFVNDLETISEKIKMEMVVKDFEWQYQELKAQGWKLIEGKFRPAK